jgi:glycerol uptake facilitator-like aquaporin
MQEQQLKEKDFVAIGIYLLGKISMAHFNPAVTAGYLITGHIKEYS